MPAGKDILAQAMDKVGDRYDDVRADEREWCARIAERFPLTLKDSVEADRARPWARQISDAIRNAK